VLPRQVAFRILLVSIAASSLLGIIAVLGSGLGAGSGKALVTALVVSGASLLAMAAFAAWDLPAARLFSRLGVVGSTVAMILVVAGIWVEPRGEAFWQTTATAASIAVGGAHGSMLMLARLAPRYQWARTAAIAVGTLLVAAVLAAVWEVEKSDNFFKVIGALAIAEASLTLTVSALRVAGHIAPPEHGVAEVCFCPRCGKRLWLPAGEVRCRHCEEAFFIELRAKGNLPDAVVRGD
jgi:hypothetical protein